MENICEWENCNELGQYRAPLEKDNSKNFKWLCEEHIKLFNKNWNYFDGMSQDQIENFLKSDLTWHKSTQEFGSSNNFFNILWNNALSDEFRVFYEKKYFKSDNRKFTEKDRDAFVIMGLELNADWPTVQKKFKTLVKKFHPDKNSGNKQYEDKLKKITLAYSHLKMIVVNNKK